MKPRERVLTALEHREPDSVPLDFLGGVSSITLQAYVKLKEYLGLAWEGEKYDFWNVMITIDPGILRLFKIDFRRVGLNLPAGWKMKVYPDGTFLDEWGLRRKPSPDGLYYEVVPTLQNVIEKEDIDNHPWPNSEAPGLTDGLRKMAKELEEAGWAVATSPVGGGIFEIAWWLRGFNNFIKDLYTNPDFACYLLNKITEVQISLFDILLDEVGDYVVMVQIGDDLGTQTGPLIPLNLYRKYIKPYHKKLCDFIHRKTDAKIMIHSCGAVEPFISDFIDAGIDVLNPVQPLAKGMDTKILKEKYGDKICFHGGIDTQRVLPYGTPLEVRKEVKRRIRDLAPNGGYILAPSHNIQVDTSPENIIALYKAAQKYGKYKKD
ncbi:MAG: uroporphyrinogen decarboxylase family protein [Nitrososphaeria archaeon]